MGSRLESNSNAVRKRIENHAFEDEDGDEYEGSKFGGFTDYFRRKKIKLQNLDADLRSQSGDKPQIFRGVVAHINGYTQPSLNDLHKLIVTHGGGFMQYLDGKTAVTHIIASSLTPKKAVELKRYRIVKPAWVVESVRAGKLLPWNDFRVVDEGENQRLLAFDNGKVVSQVNAQTKGYRDQTDNSWYTSQLKGSSSTPSSSSRPCFSRQRQPTPDDDEIEDLPPSHQPEDPLQGASYSVGHAQLDGEPTKQELVTPPKTSPPPELKEALNEDEALANDVDTPNDDSAGLLSDDGPHGVKRLQAEGIEPQSKRRKLTAEEHNAILLADPKLRKSTVVDPNFLEQYYRESRLHHLSTWKADLKAQLQALASEKSSSQKTKQKRPSGARRYILHVDFDCFFAAVSLKKNPQWKDKPAVVAHGNGSGSEIASCNYPARKFGIKNGMWMKRAQELCPDLKILPYDFPAYEEASRAFYDAILATGGIVQSVSIDEALIDASVLCYEGTGGDGRKITEGSIYREQANADEIARKLRDQVKGRTNCNVSVGIGGNILLAKVALRKAKPAGQYQIKPEEVLDFLGNLEVQDLPGVAWSIGGRLEEIGIKYVKDIREFSKEKLVRTLGPKTGEKLWEYARGIDRTEVGEQVIRKSVSAEVNWGVRFENQEQADEFIESLCGELTKRLLKEKVKGKQLTMKVMRRSPDAPLDPPKHLGHGKCDTYNKSMLLGVATNATEILTKEALSMLRGFNFPPGELRGIGIQMTKLEPMKSSTDGQAESSQRRLQFKVQDSAPASARKAQKAAVADIDPIQDDPETPKKQKPAENEHIAFGAHKLNELTPSRRPLNTLGTQFVLPTQADPKVLAELPESIRSKLLRQRPRPTSPTPAPRNVEATTSEPSSPSIKPERTKSHTAPFALTALPAQSQLDPEILAALPEEVKAEVLAQYAAGATPASPSRRGEQTLLPQSPRKDKPLKNPTLRKPAPPPIKRGRGRPPKNAFSGTTGVGKREADKASTLIQANFITLKGNGSRQGSAAPDSEPEELDTEFLSALPEDIRREIIEEHKRKKLQARSNLQLQKKAGKMPVAPQQSYPKVIQIPRPVRPTFTTQKLWKMGDLRDAIKEWFLEFREEGPYNEDVGALGAYLGKVVLEERDMAKAVDVVKWMVWYVDDGIDESGDGKVDVGKWREAVERVKGSVQGAIRERGIGPVQF